MVRVEVEEVVGLGAYEIVRRRGAAAGDADGLGEGVESLFGESGVSR